MAVSAILVLAVVGHLLFCCFLKGAPRLFLQNGFRQIEHIDIEIDNKDMNQHNSEQGGRPPPSGEMPLTAVESLSQTCGKVLTGIESLSQWCGKELMGIESLSR